MAEIIVTKGESKRVVLDIKENNVDFDVSQATDITATLNVQSSAYRYALGNVAGTGKLTNSESMVGVPPVPESLDTNQIALYLEASQTSKYKAGFVDVDIEVTFLDSTFDSGKSVVKFCLTPIRVIDAC